MRKIQVNASKKYDVIVGEGLLSNPIRYIKNVTESGKIMIVTDDIVAGFYLDNLKSELEKARYQVSCFIIRNGEKSKNASNYISLLNDLAKNFFTRSDTIIALGGGVVGDLSGFAAATYLRGIKFIQVPTSLLAMVDSSVGGKTAIDLDAGKNLAGAFYQPALVLCDITALNTLDKRIFSDGCAEIIKYAVIGSIKMYNELKRDGLLFNREEIISDCIKMKAEIVSKDEFDTGKRQLLNFGHTIGHAVEKCSGYEVTHGHGVAIGMVRISRAAKRLGYSKCDIGDLETVIKKFGLPIETKYEAKELYKVMLNDKKRKGNSLTIVIPEETGRCELKKIEIEELPLFLNLEG